MKLAHTTATRRRSGPALPALQVQPAAPADLGGRLRVVAQSASNPQRAREAAAAIRKLGAGLKPSKKHGAAATVRALRDGGD